ncbi:MAG TPA: hypothetical protein VF731_04960 [Solirubrobacterales bacterium]
MRRKRRRISIGLALAAALCACALLSAVGAGSADAAVEPSSTLFYSTADFSFRGKLWSVHADGSGRRLLRSGVVTGPSGVAAVLARDRKRILCLCRKDEIDSMRLDGSRMRAIGRRPKGTKYDTVELAANGEPIWVDERHDRLVMERPDRSHRRVVGTPRPGEYLESFAVSPAVDKVAFAAGSCGHGECWVNVWIQAIGGGSKKLAYRTAGERDVGGLQWSGDGRALAFVDFPEEEKGVEPADPNEHLLVYSGGKATEVPVAAPASPFPPFFSPDRSTLAVGGKRAGRIYAVAAAGGPPRLITDTGCRGGCLFGPSVFGWLRG